MPSVHHGSYGSYGNRGATRFALVKWALISSAANDHALVISAPGNWLTTEHVFRTWLTSWSDW
jgi:hypothetical protein